VDHPLRSAALPLLAAFVACQTPKGSPPPRHPTSAPAASDGSNTTAESDACEVTREAPAGLPNPDTRTVRVRVNQVGYRPGSTKRASLADGSNDRLPWALRDQSGQVVARGLTWVLGNDPASGDHVHEADFSCVDRVGYGYRLQIDGHTSVPFSIADDVYDELRREALAFFYRHRSGVQLDQAYAGDDWAMPAGHPGDGEAQCHPQAQCNALIDAAGGWYGDGSMGKYTVGSTLAIWTLQNLYERNVVLGTGQAATQDGLLTIPEATNGKPDLLDLARVHLEWMLKLQHPEESPRAGMIFHKLHGEVAIAPGTMPHQDRSARSVRGPTTAATLQFAAVAAQAARIWKKHDPAFAKRCLDAARRAYEAARVNAVVAAPVADAAGGLPYADDDVLDEAYWASVELALTTGETEYVEFATASPMHAQAPPSPAGMPPIIYWDQTQGIAMLDIALVGGPFEEQQVEAVRQVVLDAADGYLRAAGSRGYRSTLRTQVYGDSTTFELLRNAMVMTLAGDLTGQLRYRTASQDTLDWILGRNALGRAYVTGFGANPVERPHHTYWYDNPPPGLLVNGPNGNLSDPVAKEQLEGCTQEKCYLDDPAAISVNRVADHGNAALAWIVTALSQ